VQDRKPRELGRGDDQQVGDGRGPVLPPVLGWLKLVRTSATQEHRG
jgi:hypothetical protein